MTWVFAILAVLVVGGVAVVASGRLGAMPEPERREGGLPGEGAVTADELRHVRFTPVLRGYRMDEVDGLLDRLATQLEDARGTATAPPVEGDDAPAAPRD